MIIQQKNWEGIFPIIGRVGGSFISDIPLFFRCIDEGKEGLSGYDVGFCRGRIFSVLMDT